MTEFNSVFFDTAIFIYLLEHNEAYYDKSMGMFADSIAIKANMYTSSITYEEYCVYPFMCQKPELITNFEKFVRDLDIKIICVDDYIAKIAAQLRAKYKHIKAMDALQLASAIAVGADLFVTNDKQLKQIEEIEVITLDK